MNRCSRLVPVILSILFYQLAYANAASPVLLNQNFEVTNLTDLTRQGWNFILGQDAFADFSLANGGPGPGKKCLAVDVLRLGQQNPWDIQLIKEDVAVTSGKLYQYSLWFKGDRGSEVSVGIETPKYISMANRKVVLTGEWQQVAIEFVPEQAFVRLAVHFSFDESFGSIIYVDEIVLEQAS